MQRLVNDLLNVGVRVLNLVFQFNVNNLSNILGVHSPMRKVMSMLWLSVITVQRSSNRRFHPIGEAICLGFFDIHQFHLLILSKESCQPRQILVISQVKKWQVGGKIGRA
ncbi:hypothetical protein [Levilactobacillus cerevisiae]|uniref:hypothetical protein n=1 Tax=Levilactobacillus cerevisiae TaxID=1704076 RepID=UPI000F77716D|nr:hypothetical protein [Levilactobacillus cerevisiae]